MTTVLIVDDSILFRKLMESILKEMEGIEVVGSVFNGQKALDLIEKSPPDLVTLDLEMPDMNGIQVLEEIQKLNKTFKKPVKTIMISGQHSAGASLTIDALEKGAFDFIAKPTSENRELNEKKLRDELHHKIRGSFKKSRRPSQPKKATSSASKTLASKAPSSPAPVSSPRKSSQPVDLICIGVSTGGPEALQILLPELTKLTHLPILVVQHMPIGFTNSLASSLNRTCEHKVQEVSGGELVRPRNIYIAQGGKHMVASGTPLKILLDDAPPLNGFKPSVDQLFQTLANNNTIYPLGIILTGMGEDGAKGLKLLRDRGCTTLAQDRESSVVWGMPGKAVDIDAAQEVVSLTAMAERVSRLLR